MDESERNRQIAEDAADWWVRLQLEAESQSTREQYVKWLRESPAHIAEMLRMGKVHGLLGKYPGWRQRVADQASDDACNVVSLTSAVKGTAPNAGRTRTRPSWMAGIAACIAALLIGSTSLWAAWRGQIIDTPRGERRELALEDGTFVQLDPQTRVRVKLRAHSRTVFLERGRAVFRVAEDSNRPFLVNADSALIRAVGTAFGVDRSRQNVIVTVIEGKVAVSSQSSGLTSIQQLQGDGSQRKRDATRSDTLPRSSAAPALLVSANEQVMVPQAGSVQPVRKVDSNRELAWAEGRLVFENDTVAEVVESFNRYNKTQIHVADSVLAARPVSGIFNASAPESFIRFLRSVANVKVVRDHGENVTIASAP